MEMWVKIITATTVIVIAVLIGGSIMTPTQMDREIVEAFVRAHDQALLKKDATLYRSHVTSDVRSSVHPPSDFSPDGVDHIIQYYTARNTIITADRLSTATVLRVENRSSEIKKILFDVRSTENAGKSVYLERLEVTFVLRKGEWLASSIENHR